MKALLFQVRGSMKEHKMSRDELEFSMGTKFSHYESIGIPPADGLDCSGLKLFRVIKGKRRVPIGTPIGGPLVLVHYVEI